MVTQKARWDRSLRCAHDETDRGSLMTIDIGIYLPQVSLTFDQILEQALRVERLGLTSFWLYDHLSTPMLPDRSALEGWTLATALLARTTSVPAVAPGPGRHGGSVGDRGAAAVARQRPRPSSDQSDDGKGLAPLMARTSPLQVKVPAPARVHSS